LAIAPPTEASLATVVGGLSRRPRAVDDQIAVREILDLTWSIDHDVIEGARATRVGADIRRRTSRHSPRGSLRSSSPPSTVVDLSL
jgi:pyruvate/2-oxoglutarate dehydrogenase complex dihydrolipoamide acyltransferase (E2) component